MQRAAKRTFESADHNYRPGNVHDDEWDKAMGEMGGREGGGCKGAHTTSAGEGATNAHALRFGREGGLER